MCIYSIININIYIDLKFVLGRIMNVEYGNVE